MLAAATAIGALGLAAGGSAGALLAEDMTGNTALAGLPLGALVAGSAVSALLISWRTGRAGRTAGLVLGYAIGTAGAALVIAAAVVDDLALLLAGSAALGAANAAIFLSRYAAAELGGETGRGRALGVVFFATAVGAVLSPNLLGPSGDLAEAVGLPGLAGLYLVALAAFVGAGFLLAALPSASLPVGEGRAVTRSELRAGLWSARVALVLLAVTNLVMVAVMAIAPIHMMEHGHGLDLVGVIVSIHVLCMFAPSPVTGWLADRAGSAIVAALGARPDGRSRCEWRTNGSLEQPRDDGDARAARARVERRSRRGQHDARCVRPGTPAPAGRGHRGGRDGSRCRRRCARRRSAGRLRRLHHAVDCCGELEGRSCSPHSASAIERSPPSRSSLRRSELTTVLAHDGCHAGRLCERLLTQRAWRRAPRQARRSRRSEPGARPPPPSRDRRP